MEEEFAKTHDLKIWPTYFGAILNGDKTFELRKDDRGFHLGDTLHLREYYLPEEKYTGRYIQAVVTHIYKGEMVANGYCAMSFKITAASTLEREEP